MADDLVFKLFNNLCFNLRSDILKLIHEGHVGIKLCKNQIKNVLFWSSILNDIKNILKSRQICSKYCNNNRESMISYTILDVTWQKLSMDLFHRDSKTYLLVVDFVSHLS